MRRGQRIRLRLAYECRAAARGLSRGAASSHRVHGSRARKRRDIAPNCRWESWANNRAQRQGVPTLQPRTGPAGVADFFAVVGELQMHDFQVLDVIAGERQVAVEVVIDYSMPGGGRLRDEELHLWTLDEHQRVVRLRHYVDTAKHIAAYAGEDTTTEN